MSSRVFRGGIVSESAIQTCGYGIAVHVLRAFGVAFEANVTRNWSPRVMKRVRRIKCVSHERKWRRKVRNVVTF
jgi:hypothetical protein